MSATVTGPLFKWFGSKWLSSKKMPVPRHDIVVEPFAGGAGYALRHVEQRVILGESDPHIYRLWCWLIGEASEQDVRDIPVDLPVGTDIRTLGLTDGQALLLKSWQRTNNVGDCWTVSPWGNRPGQWTRNTRARIASEFQAVQHWTVFESADQTWSLTEPATWFIDPPYRYNYQYRKAPIDYAGLAQQIAGLRGHVIVCEATCPKTGAVPDWLPFREYGDRITSRRRIQDRRYSKELVWERT